MTKKSTFLELKKSERAHRRDLILDAAMHLFAEHPFHKIGMREIADEAGISPASIYRYFSSRDDILAEILGHEVKEGRFQQSKSIEEGSSLEEVAEIVVDFFMDKEATVQMLSHFLLKEDLDEEALEKFYNIRSYYLQELNQVLIGLGCDPGNVSLFSMAFFSSLLGIMSSSKKGYGHEEDQEEYKKNVKRLARLTATIFKRGMLEQE